MALEETILLIKPEGVKKYTAPAIRSMVTFLSNYSYLFVAGCSVKMPADLIELAYQNEIPSQEQEKQRYIKKIAAGDADISVWKGDENIIQTMRAWTDPRMANNNLWQLYKDTIYCPENQETADKYINLFFEKKDGFYIPKTEEKPPLYDPEKTPAPKRKKPK